MPLRTKLLLLLLGISVLPLLLQTWYGVEVTRRLDHSLTERSRVSAENDLIQELQRQIQFNARLLEKQRELMELALDLQVLAVERRLALTKPKGVSVYYAAEFDRPGAAVPGLALSTKHLRRTPDDGRTPMAVSYEQQSLQLAPGVEPAEVQLDVQRLSTLTHDYRTLNREYPYLFYWQYTALESGVHTAFPGHGGYPPDFDPRDRDWYQRALNAGATTWNPPMVDATSGQAMLTLSAPVRSADGFIAGVTAIDVPIMSLLGEASALTGLIGQDIETLLVHFLRDQPETENALLVVAHGAYLEQVVDWRTPLQTHALQSSDRRGFQLLVNDLRTRRGGTRRLPYQGEDALWVYGPVDLQDDYLFYIVPYRDVLAEIERIRLPVRDATAAQLRASIVLVVALTLAIALLALVISRGITRPVRDLAEAAHRLASGDFDQHLEPRGHDELAQLGRTFNRMVGKLRERMAMRQALGLAREVQQNLLPETPPRLPGLDIGAFSRYCDETGGDYYDYLDLSGEHPPRVGIALGDVSGHGFASALLMTAARALLRNRAAEGEDLDRQIGLLNQGLTQDAHGGRFMTLFYLVINLRDRRLRWVNAGHSAALRYSPDQDRFSELGGEDIPLGVDRHWRFHCHLADDWSPREWILLYTDGVTEARNAEGEHFGLDRLKAAVRLLAERDAAGLCQGVREAVDQFRQGAPQHDDLTLVAVCNRTPECQHANAAR